jgi:hypothetical protein
VRSLLSLRSLNYAGDRGIEFALHLSGEKFDVARHRLILSVVHHCGKLDSRG